MDVPLKNYSSGMHDAARVRDRGDHRPRRPAARRDLRRRRRGLPEAVHGARCSRFQARGKTILFVSHSAAAVQAICRRVARPRSRAAAVRRRRGRRPDRIPAADGVSPHEALGPAAGEPRVTTRPPRSDEPPNPDLAWHRLATGGRWDEEGAWVFDFLRRQGLRPRSLRARRRLRQPLGREPAAAATWSRATTGASRRTSSSSSPARRSSCRAPACASERGHFIVNDDFDLSEVAAPLRPGDRQLALPAPAAQQRRPRHRRGRPRARAGRTLLRDLAREPGSATHFDPRRSATGTARRPTATASRFTTASRCWRRSPRSSGPRRAGGGHDPPARRIGDGDHARIAQGRPRVTGRAGDDEVRSYLDVRMHSWARPPVKTRIAGDRQTSETLWIRREPRGHRPGSRGCSAARGRAVGDPCGIGGRARRSSPPQRPLPAGAAGLGGDAVPDRRDPIAATPGAPSRRSGASRRDGRRAA